MMMMMMIIIKKLLTMLIEIHIFVKIFIIITDIHIHHNHRNTYSPVSFSRTEAVQNLGDIAPRVRKKSQILNMLLIDWSKKLHKGETKYQQKSCCQNIEIKSLSFISTNHNPNQSQQQSCALEKEDFCPNYFQNSKAIFFSGLSGKMQTSVNN